MSSAAVAQAPQTVRTRTYFQDAMRRFFRHKLAIAGLLILIIEIGLVIFAGQVAGHDPYLTDPTAFAARPGPAHLLGADSLGRDVFARLLYGGRISLAVGLVSTAVAVVIGVPLGLLAGFRGGAIDHIIMRSADVFMAFPAIILILMLVAVVGPSIWSVMGVIGLLGWPFFARLIRGNVLSLREREFVQGARALGARDLHIMVRHILPNSLAPVLVAATFRISQSMLLEASLSFLGMGVQPPQASWGNMLYDAQSITTLATRPWMWMPAGVAIILSVLSINFVGDGIRDALDPKMKM